MSLDSIVIGIDLGTTNSCASYYVDGKLRILENSEGGRTTPSLIFFNPDGSFLVGQYAKCGADRRPENCAYEMKRLLGRDFQDSCVQKKLRFFPFTIQEVDGKPTVAVRFENETVLKSPQELSSIVLAKIKADVDERLDGNVTKAVITVPAYFNSLQRKETLEAAKQAGFTVLKLFNEPNAAALSFYHENVQDECKFVLVYDLGGGTFDVSILKKSGANVEVLSVDGDSHLGGNDFDDLIVDFVCVELLEKYGWNERANKRKMRRLNAKCEEAKKALSRIKATDILLEAFVSGHDVVEIPLSKSRFEGLIDELLTRTLAVTKRCIDNSGIKKGEIERVVLAGGSTRIPKIHVMLSEYFGKGIVKATINPDECVASGAALQAAMLSSHPRQKCEITKIVDVVPLSIGTPVLGGCMSFLIKKNTQIPVSVTATFVNVTDQQSVMGFPIYEGERLDIRKNRKLGEVTINLTPAPPGECEASLTLHIDSTGILTCTAEEEISGNRKAATIDFYTRGIRSDGEVREAIDDAERNKAEDEEFRAYSKRIKYLTKYCIGITYNLTKKNLKLSHKNVFDRCEEIDSNMGKDTFFYSCKTIEDVLLEELTEKCDFLVKNYNFEKMPTRDF